MLAFALFMLAFVSGAPDSVRVVAVEPRSPAEQAGLRAGDLVLRVDGKPVRSADGLHAVVSSGLGRRLELTILRDERETILSLTPRTGWSPDGRAAGFDSTGVLVRYPLGAAGLRAAQSIGDQLRAVPGSWPSGTDGAGRIQMAGLVGMKRLSDRAFENSRNWGEPFPVLFVAASLSLALGVTNLLPLPALDGGRLALVLSEWVFRRRIAVRLEQRIHAVGFGLLVAGMIALAIHDSVQPPL
jgi:regulator of sigma E protease